MKFQALFLALFLMTSVRALATEFDDEGLTALHRAAGRGDVLQIKELLTKENPLVLDSKMGVSVLHKAVYSGSAEAVRLILMGGGLPLLNLQSPSNGNTPLHDALYFKGKDWSVLEVLLSFGANPWIKNRAGLTPMDSARLLFQDSAPQDLMQKVAKDTYSLAQSPLMDAVRKNDLAQVKKIMETSGGKLSGRDENGFTPLIWAAREGFVEMTKYFLESGADPNQLDEWMGANAGHKAAFWGRAATLRLLIEYGLDINARGGYNGYTALHDAVVRGHMEVIQTLLDAGADCFIEGHDGKTAHSIAQEKGNHLVLQHQQCMKK